MIADSSRMNNILALIAFFTVLGFNVIIASPKPDNDVHFHINMAGTKSKMDQNQGRKVESGDDYANTEYSEGGGQQILKGIRKDEMEKGNDYAMQIRRKDGLWACETSHLIDDEDGRLKQLRYAFTCTHTSKGHPCTVCIKKAKKHKWWTWKTNGDQIVIPKSVNL